MMNGPLPAMLNRIDAPGSMFAVSIAWRSEPAPLSPVWVTTKSSAAVTVIVTVAVLLAPSPPSVWSWKVSMPAKPGFG